MRTLLILSGGMDSATLLWDLLNRGDEVQTVSIDYGQRHKKELACAAALARLRDVPHDLIDLTGMHKFLTGSSQSDPTVSVPFGRYDEPSMKQTVVPNRNMLLLAAAGAVAIARKMDALAYGAHAGDHAIYPDCRPAFVEAMRNCFGLCDWHSLMLNVPYLNYDKGDICRRGLELGVPFEQTWTCYVGAGWPCTKCGACQERAEAFAKAGAADPLLVHAPVPAG